jgi:hypothetical protein
MEIKCKLKGTTTIITGTRITGKTKTIFMIQTGDSIIQITNGIDITDGDLKIHLQRLHHRLIQTLTSKLHIMITMIFGVMETTGIE